MIRKTWIVTAPVTVLASLTTSAVIALADSPCLDALAQSAVCPAANRRALEIMTAKQLKAVTVVQDVRTGAVVAFAASHPSDLDVATAMCPLSLSKLLLCASWWDNLQPDSGFDDVRGTPAKQNSDHKSRVSVHEILVGGSDFAGKQMAIALRKSVGAKTVLEDFKRYGFGQRSNLRKDEIFWGELAPTWKARLTPPAASVSLSNATNDDEWAETLSIGEMNMSVTALDISRFLQAIGNHGLMLPAVARDEQSERSSVPHQEPRNSMRVMRESTALRLQSAMRDCVQRGSAKSIARALEGSGWHIGGKTGSGTALMPKGPQIDGWFAGLIFDPESRAKFTVATFVRSGGYGGENAAKISAELARYLIAATPR